MTTPIIIFFPQRFHQAGASYNVTVGSDETDDDEKGIIRHDELDASANGEVAIAEKGGEGEEHDQVKGNLGCS